MIKTFLKQCSPRTILAMVAALALLPFLIVEEFHAQLYRVMDSASYLVFRNTAEFFSIMVSLSIFGVGWYAYDQSKDRHALFLSSAFLAIGLMDFMHTLGYAGMPAFITPNSANKSTQFWIAARLFTASTFLVSAWVYPDKPSPWLTKTKLITGAFTLSALVFIAVTFFPSSLPATFREGVGLTSFKKFSEFAIIGLLFLASVAYWRRMSRTQNRLLIYYISAFVLCIFSEFVFAVYKSVFDSFNVLGHCYKVIAFYLIYQGIFITSVKYPYVKLRDASEKMGIEINERKKAEGKIISAKKEWERTFDAITDPIIIVDTDYRIVRANKATADKLGVAPSGVVGLTCYQAIHGLNGPPPFCPHTEVLLDGRSRAVEIHEDHLGGDYLISASPLFTDEGTLYGSVNYLRDITERKRAEEDIRESENKYRQLFELESDALFLIDNETGDILEVNPAASALYGYTKEELLSKKNVDLSAEADKTRAAMREKARNIILRWHCKKDGTVFPVDIAASHVIREGRPVHIAAIRDITDRMRAEDELRESEKRYKQLLESITNYIYTVRLEQGRPVSTTHGSACVSVTGYTSEEYNADPYLWYNMIHEEDRDRVVKHMSIILDGGTALSIEHRIFHKDETLRWIKDTLVPKYDARGQLVAYDGLVTDITERRTAEETIKRNNEELETRIRERTRALEQSGREIESAKIEAEAANKAKSDFLANMSHELRTPLNSILGFSEVLHDELYGPINEKQKGYLEYIYNSGRHLLAIINDILDLSKVESGRLELEVSRVPLTAVLKGALTMLKEKAMKHRIAMSLAVDPGATIEINTDERKLKQIMFNLLSNAVKFTPDGGSVRVTARIIRNSEFGIRNKDEKTIPHSAFGIPHLEISVADTGIGIKPEDIDRLFKPFSQLEYAYTKTYEGTGLGLELTKRLVEFLGGRIWVESEFGKGSAFTFVIPIQDETLNNREKE